MTNRELIYQAKKLVREVNADTRLPSKLIHSIAKKHSRLLIYRDSERLKLTKKTSLFKTLKCVDVEKVPLIDECCGIKTNCEIWRTVKKLPKIYEDSYGPIIKKVTTIDGFKKFNLTRASDWERKQNNPWIKNNKNEVFFFEDSHLYFPGNGYKKINVEAYFEDDITSYNYCSESNITNVNGQESCSRFLEQEFTIPDYLEAALMDMVLKELLTYKQIPEKSHQIDKNDSSFDIKS